MHTFKPLLALICLSLFITGCATMSAEDCSGADWQTIGLSDGTAGPDRWPRLTDAPATAPDMAW